MEKKTLTPSSLFKDNLHRLKSSWFRDLPNWAHVTQHTFCNICYGLRLELWTGLALITSFLALDLHHTSSRDPHASQIFLLAEKGMSCSTQACFKETWGQRPTDCVKLVWVIPRVNNWPLVFLLWYRIFLFILRTRTVIKLVECLVFSRMQILLDHSFKKDDIPLSSRIATSQ